jgi:NNP family nitrate/nitrite transporter-like MFS transporter
MLLALGMGVANAAVFKLVPRFTPKAVGGAAGIIGGLGAFGGFVLPPIMGIFVRLNGEAGYSQGFAVFLGLSLAGLAFLMILKKYTETKLP